MRMQDSLSPALDVKYSTSNDSVIPGSYHRLTYEQDQRPAPCRWPVEKRRLPSHAPKRYSTLEPGQWQRPPWLTSSCVPTEKQNGGEKKESTVTLATVGTNGQRVLTELTE